MPLVTLRRWNLQSYLSWWYWILCRCHLEHLVAVMVDLLVMLVLVALGAVGALDSEGGGGGGEERKGNWRRPRRSWRCGTIWERGPPLCACNPNQAQPWDAILEMSSDKLPKGYLSEVVIEYYSWNELVHPSYFIALNSTDCSLTKGCQRPEQGYMHPFRGICKWYFSSFL